MRTLSVQSSQRAYPVVLGENVLRHIGSHLASLGFDKDVQVAVITDETVVQTPIARVLEHALEAAHLKHVNMVVPAGDASKSLETVTSLYEKLIAAGMRRKDLILALGGGVIGDLAGFVAATFLRGVPFIQAPTTLLSHDSSIGGKVGVNLPQGKNLVGAFYPPRAVLFDLDALPSLPERQWRNGMSEVIKHGIIGNAELFAQLENHPLTRCPDAMTLEPILAAAMQVKIDVVNADEREQGGRQVLNVGHTIGHAIEQRSHYALGHGEAIAIGLVLEAELAVKRGVLAGSTAVRIADVLRLHGLPTVPPTDDFAAVRQVMDVDKKHSGAQWTLALPVSIGDVRVFSDVAPSEVEEVYREAMEGKRR